MEQPRNLEVKETIDSKREKKKNLHFFVAFFLKKKFIVLHEMATILNTGLDRDAVALCISLCERGANPEALAVKIKFFTTYLLNFFIIRL